MRYESPETKRAMQRDRAAKQPAPGVPSGRSWINAAMDSDRRVVFSDVGPRAGNFAAAKCGRNGDVTWHRPGIHLASCSESRFADGLGRRRVISQYTRPIRDSSSNGRPQRRTREFGRCGRTCIEEPIDARDLHSWRRRCIVEMSYR